MPGYRRAQLEGGTFFLTVVTHHRRRILCGPGVRRVLARAFAETRATRPFAIEGIVLLPDHLHVMLRLPSGDGDFSGRIGQIKSRFTRAYLTAGGSEAPATSSRTRQRYRGVWEKRFWEHTIRNVRDYCLHLDYIHYNPVKHGLVAKAADWPFSSFHRYVRLGRYAPDWAGPEHSPNTEYIEPW